MTQGIVALAPFALWAPSSLATLQSFAVSAPLQPIVAITSWSANTGLADVQTPELLASLRVFQAAMPSHTSLLVVPDADLRALQTDQFPAGIIIRGGSVVFNAPLSSEGSMRMLLQTLPAGSAPQPERARRRGK